jgi:serine/threonine-protein kinase HipA
VRAFGLTKDAAVELIKQMVKVVDGWAGFFKDHGVRASDMDHLAQYIDGPALGAQRAEFR